MKANCRSVLDRGIRVLVVSVLFICLGQDLMAGFSSKKRGIVRVRIGPMLSSGELSTLGMHPPFKDLTPAEIQKRVDEISKRIDESIEVIGGEFPEVGSFLKSLKKQRHLCFEFGSKKQSSALKVKSTGGGFKVRLNLGEFPQNPAAPESQMYDEEGFKMIKELVYQGCVGVAKTSEGDKKSTKSERTAAQLKDICAQVSALQKNVKWLKAYRMTLEQYAAAGAVPKGVKGISKKLIESLDSAPNLSATERRARSLVVRASVSSCVKALEKRLKTKTNRKISLTKQSSLLPGDQPDGYYADMGGARSLSEEFVSVDGTPHTLTGGGGEFLDDGEGDFAPDNQVLVTAFPLDGSEPVEAMISFEPLTTLTGFEFNQETGDLFVAGYGSEGGGVYVVGDGNSDGVPEGPASPVLPEVENTDGFVLKASGPGELIAMDRSDRDLILFSDLDKGIGRPGVPDTFAPIGNLGPSPRPVQELFCSPDGRVIFGSDGDGAGDDLIVPDVRLPQANWDDDSGAYVATRPANPFFESAFPPGSAAPVEGWTTLEFTGMPFGEYQLTVASPPGSAPMVVDTRCAGPQGGGVFIHPDSPFPVDGEVQIIDVSNGLDGAPVEVMPLRPKPELSFPGGTAEFGNVQTIINPILVRDYPHARGYLQTGEDLFGWARREEVRTNADGDGFATVDFPGVGRTFIRWEREDPVLQEFSSQTVSVTPGLLTTIDLLEGVDLRTGQGIELVTPPPEFNGNFKWHGNGKVTVNLPTFGGVYEFTARAIFGGEKGPEFTIEVSPGTKEELINPPLFVDELSGELFVEAPVLVLEDGLSYPMYQFGSSNGGGDLLCLFPHWHGSGEFSIEDYPIGLPFIELYGACGYGLIFPFYNPAEAPTVPEDVLWVRLDLWEEFKMVHP